MYSQFFFQYLKILSTFFWLLWPHMTNLLSFNYDSYKMYIFSVRFLFVICFQKLKHDRSWHEFLLGLSYLGFALLLLTLVLHLSTNSGSLVIFFEYFFLIQKDCIFLLGSDDSEHYLYYHPLGLWDLCLFSSHLYLMTRLKINIFVWPLNSSILSWLHLIIVLIHHKLFLSFFHSSFHCYFYDFSKSSY